MERYYATLDELRRVKKEIDNLEKTARRARRDDDLNKLASTNMKLYDATKEYKHLEERLEMLKNW